jgi:formylglycine-generating enzyme required for sulfatase activity
MRRRNREKKASSIQIASHDIWILGIVVIAAIGGIVHSYRTRNAELHYHVSAAAEGFGPTVENHSPPSGLVPEGMVWIPGGDGCQCPPHMDDVGMKATTDARPVHRVYVDGFYIDKTDVTNAQFAEFVKATRYVTVAERKPRAEDVPGASPEELVAGAVVFTSPDHPVSLNDYMQWWTYIKGGLVPSPRSTE